MTGLAWTTLYNAFADFAYEARRHRFYMSQIDEMEDSLFEMCPFPKRFRIGNEKKGEQKK